MTKRYNISDKFEKWSPKEKGIKLKEKKQYKFIYKFCLITANKCLVKIFKDSFYEEFGWNLNVSVWKIKDCTSRDC